MLSVPLALYVLFLSFLLIILSSPDCNLFETKNLTEIGTVIYYIVVFWVFVLYYGTAVTCNYVNIMYEYLYYFLETITSHKNYKK